MFMVGFDIDTRAYSTFPTSIIAIPTGIKILNWLATIWSSCFSSITPLYLIIGFLFSFSFEGFTGLYYSRELFSKYNLCKRGIYINIHGIRVRIKRSKNYFIFPLTSFRWMNRCFVVNVRYQHLLIMVSINNYWFIKYSK